MAGLSAEAAAEMKRVSSDVWFAYLERFTLPEACGHGGIRVREDFRCGRTCPVWVLDPFTAYVVALNETICMCCCQRSISSP